jgi:NAD(P)-dependent dehydrogenase (short-subunit alcohol dehydrogenase family)
VLIADHLKRAASSACPNTSCLNSILNVTKDVYPAIAPNKYSRSEFTGKIVVVTGGGNGLGKAARLAFAQLGSHVAFADIVEAEADSAAKEARESFGVKAIAVHMDVCKLQDNERLVQVVERELGEVDCVIFSAVVARWDTLDLTTSEGWWNVMEKNLKGPVDLTRLLLPGMLKRNTGTFIYHASRVYLLDGELR